MIHHSGGTNESPSSPSVALKRRFSPSRGHPHSSRLVTTDKEFLPEVADPLTATTAGSSSSNEVGHRRDEKQPRMKVFVYCHGHIDGPRATTIRFSDDCQIEYLHDEEVSVKEGCRKDLWYRKSELVKMRELDRDLLLSELHAVTSPTVPVNAANSDDDKCTIDIPATNSTRKVATPSSSTQAQNDRAPSLLQPPPPPPPPPVSRRMTAMARQEPAELFCFRGLEGVINKREREVTKKRALGIVLNEQHRYRCRQIGRMEVVKANDRPQVTIPVLDVPLHTILIVIQISSALDLQERISSRYRLASRQSTDEAYLRGLRTHRRREPFFNRVSAFRPTTWCLYYLLRCSRRPKTTKALSTPRPKTRQAPMQKHWPAFFPSK